MFGDEESVFDRLSELIWERFDFLIPLRIIKRPESLTIIDYRPTLSMFLTAIGFLILGVSLVILLFKFDIAIFIGLTTIGIPLAVCVIFLFRGTIREAYYFNKETDSYAFVRQFIHRQEVIEGALGQFTGASVKTEENEDSKTHFVVLKQDAMFLTGVDEQTLREQVPIFNSFAKEAQIANAISEFIHSKS